MTAAGVSRYTNRRRSCTSLSMCLPSSVSRDSTDTHIFRHFYLNTSPHTLLHLVGFIYDFNGNPKYTTICALRGKYLCKTTDFLKRQMKIYGGFPGRHGFYDEWRGFHAIIIPKITAINEVLLDSAFEETNLYLRAKIADKLDNIHHHDVQTLKHKGQRL